MLGLLVALVATVPALKVQLGSVDLTPPEALPLGGYTARNGALAQPGGEHLQARVLLLSQGKTHIAIVSVEMLTVPESLVASVRQRLPKDLRLMMCATHTHCAPDSQMLNSRMTMAIPGIATFSPRWLDWYAERIAMAVRGALASKRLNGSTLKLVQAQVDANRCRRPQDKPDKTASFLLSASGNVLFSSYAAHPTFFDEHQLQTTGDWSGKLMRTLGGVMALGPIGDVSPVAPGSGPVEKCASLVEKLREGLRSGPPKRALAKGDRLVVIEVPIRLPRPTPHPGFGKSYKVPDALAQVLVTRFAAPEAHIIAARLGSVVLVGIPGEPTAALGRRIARICHIQGFPHPIILSHVNGWIGYILEPTDYDSGGYEATLSFYGRTLADRVTDAAKEAVSKLTPKGRS